MTKTAFLKSVYELINKKRKVLAFVRIPNSGNNRHYFFIENRNQLDNLIRNSKVNDSITIFKKLTELDSVLITEEFVKSKIESLSENDFNPELVIVNDTYEEYEKNGYTEWECAENKTDFKNNLIDNIGKFVTIVSEADFCDEQNTYHLYVPNENGISEPGVAY